MLKIIPAVILLAVFNVACAQDTAGLNCAYAEKVTYHLPALENATYLSEAKGVDPDSQEETITHTIQYANGDTAILEQKYCSMYNFQLSYKIKKLNRTNFEHSLNNIDKLIRDVQQDYKLKAPLKDVVDMTMNQRGLSIDSAFSYDLPAQAAKSSERVEQTISFAPHGRNGSFDAEIEFYFGLGGE
ncbi:MAG: hypothetical protein CVV05_05375 [Gammaproteobacteria bacterium HGW-Gammaproteobacteria-1]|jgi:hypothetical protein|nr:MAG: hypothetical protein CVV05_05375 [Gammaproteobacteria bacterium HGW-Gammaproteobacteria-1]